FGVLECDLHNWMPGHSLLQRTAWPQRIPPVRAGQIGPPVKVIAEVNAMTRFLENDRAGHEHSRQCPWIIIGIQWTFRDREVARRLYKTIELLIGDRALIHPEAIDGYVMSRGFFWIVIIRSHKKGSTRDPHHVFRRPRTRRLATPDQLF